jgi:proliferating cell nuclear antigen
MEIVIQKPNRCEIFTTLFQHMKLFSEHINIHFNDDHMFIQGMDSSHISVYEIKLPSDWFEKYTIDSRIIIGINTNILFKVLNTRDKTHSIVLKLEEPNSDKLEIHLHSESKNVVDLNYIIPLIDIDSEMMHIPDMEYEAELSFPSSTFSTLIDQMKLFGDTFNICCSEESIRMSAESQESGKMFVDIPIDDLNSYAIEEDKTLDLSFSLNHMKHICLYSKISKEINIDLKDNFPIRFTYILDDEHAKAVFYLAPKIGDD